MIPPVSDIDQQYYRRDQVQQEGNRVVDQLVDRLGNDSTGAERHQAGHQQTERPNEKGHGHQQEKQFRIAAGVDRVVPPEVPRHDPHVDGADDLRGSKVVSY